MFSLLIADDSTVEIDCIHYLLQKFDIPVETYAASDGRMALEMLRQNRYDILLTDIKMPFVTGLELAREARRLHPDIAIIFFSGYSEFEYAQSAISLGVVDYLLKPVEADRLRETISRVISALNHRQSITRNIRFVHKHLLFTLLNGDALRHGQDLMPEYRLMLMLSFGHDFFTGEGEDFEEKLRLSLQCCHEFVSLYPNEGLIFLPDGHPEPEFLAQTVRALIAHISDSDCDIAWTALTSASDIYPAYQRLTRSEPRDCDADSIHFPLTACLEAIQKNDPAQCIAHYERFRTAVLDGCSHSEIYTKYAISQVLSALNQLYPTGMSESALVNRVFSCQGFDALDRQMQQSLHSIGMNVAPQSSLRSEEVKSYIARNYASDLSLAVIAEACYLTPSYLCRLFKRETGVTLLKYLNDYRMKKAQEILETTSMKVNLVAQEVGYRSSSYFCQRFRDCFGVTPEAYRSNAMRNRHEPTTVAPKKEDPT